MRRSSARASGASFRSEAGRTRPLWQKMNETAPAFSGVVLGGVSARYKSGTEALSGFSLALKRGERLVLVGPSGAGKSTLLRLLSGLMAPSSGTLWFLGAQPRIGLVFQEPTLMPWRTAVGNVALPLRLAGVPRKAARARAKAELVALGLGEFLRAVPAELSGGMKMRVALARALVSDPELLLLDEPFAALDEITRHRLNDELLALAEARKLTLVFVTHSIFESAYLGSRVAVISARPGRVLADLRFEDERPAPEFRTSEAFRARTEAISRALEGAIGP